MNLNRTTVAVQPRYHRDDLAAMLEQIVPRLSTRVETVALALLACAFWALVLYMAILAVQ